MSGLAGIDPWRNVPRGMMKDVVDWATFRRERERVQWMDVIMFQYLPVVLGNMRPEGNGLSIDSLLKQLRHAVLFMTEVKGVGWQAGSVWKMSNELIGRGGRKREGRGLQSPRLAPMSAGGTMRFVTFETAGVAAIILTALIDDGRLAFSETRELEAGRRESLYGVIDLTSLRSVINPIFFVMAKNCSFCELRDLPCACAPSFTHGHFQTQLEMRRQRYRETSTLYGASNLRYLQEWVQGQWLCFASPKQDAVMQLNVYSCNSMSTAAPL